jgi:hypothetical protein
MRNWLFIIIYFFGIDSILFFNLWLILTFLLTNLVDKVSLKLIVILILFRLCNYFITRFNPTVFFLDDSLDIVG